MTTPKLSITVSKCSKSYRETGRLYKLPTSDIPNSLRFAQAVELLTANRVFPSITNVLDVASGDFTGWHTREMSKAIMEAVNAGERPSWPLMNRAAQAAPIYRDFAAARGTEVHGAIEDYIDGLPAREEWEHEDGRKYFRSFKEFERDFRPRFITQEVTVYGKTPSGKYYAGTLDAYAEIDGKLCLIDWKCVKSVKGKVSMQLAAAAYATMYADRETGDLLPMPKVDEAYACQLTPTEYHIYRVKDLAAAWENFCALREAWEVKVLEGGTKEEAMEEVRRPPFAHRIGQGEATIPHAVETPGIHYTAPTDDLAPII